MVRCFVLYLQALSELHAVMVFSCSGNLVPGVLSHDVIRQQLVINIRPTVFHLAVLAGYKNGFVCNAQQKTLTTADRIKPDFRLVVT